MDCDATPRRNAKAVATTLQIGQAAKIERLLLALRTIKAGAGNPEFVYNSARDVLAEFGA